MQIAKKQVLKKLGEVKFERKERLVLLTLNPIAHSVCGKRRNIFLLTPSWVNMQGGNINGFGCPSSLKIDHSCNIHINSMRKSISAEHIHASCLKEKGIWSLQAITKSESWNEADARKRVLE